MADSLAQGRAWLGVGRRGLDLRIWSVSYDRRPSGLSERRKRTRTPSKEGTSKLALAAFACKVVAAPLQALCLIQSPRAARCDSERLLYSTSLI